MTQQDEQRIKHWLNGLHKRDEELTLLVQSQKEKLDFLMGEMLGLREELKNLKASFSVSIPAVSSSTKTKEVKEHKKEVVEKSVETEKLK